MENNLPQFLLQMLNKQYDNETITKIIQGYLCNRKTTLRVNTIKSDISKIKSELDKLNIGYQFVLWYKDALILENANEKDIQNLDIYKRGEVYLQSLSSMLPPILLEPQSETDILDMAAAPGGKTTQIAALTQNKAHITACEMNKIRSEKLKYNVEKQGTSCVYVMITDARTIDDFFSFDKILLDSPCSGSGTLNLNDSKISQKFTKKLIEKSMKSQLTLLRKALKILKPGQEMVYSTCSILACENEDIIKTVLKETKAKIVPIQFSGMEDIPLLPVKLDGTICICPNELYEGFFVTKIRKE